MKLCPAAVMENSRPDFMGLGLVSVSYLKGLGLVSVLSFKGLGLGLARDYSVETSRPAKKVKRGRSAIDSNIPSEKLMFFV